MFEILGISKSDIMSENGALEYPINYRMHMGWQYNSLILVSFCKLGLVDMLTKVSQDRNEVISELAITLIAGILINTSKILPPVLSSEIEALPSLTKVALNFQEESSRHLASSRSRKILDFINNIRPAKNSALELSKSNMLYSTDKLDCLGSDTLTQKCNNLDDVQLKSVLNDSEVKLIEQAA